MKLALAAIGLLVAGISVGVACGPKEKFCYAEGEPCSLVKREMEKKDAEFMTETADATVYHCFTEAGAPFESLDPCPQ